MDSLPSEHLEKPQGKVCCLKKKSHHRAQNRLERGAKFQQDSQCLPASEGRRPGDQSTSLVWRVGSGVLSVWAQTPQLTGEHCSCRLKNEMKTANIRGHISKSIVPFRFIACVLSHFSHHSPVNWISQGSFGKRVEIEWEFHFIYLFIWCGPVFKFLPDLLQYYFGFVFWFFGRKICGILAPWLWIVPTASALWGKVLTTGLPGTSLEWGSWIKWSDWIPALVYTRRYSWTGWYFLT